MSRTESKIVRVLPGLEQATIEKMQRFFWNLMGSQEMNNQNNYLEQKKDGRVYQVREQEKYMNLVFSRDLSLPNLKEIKQLEARYNALKPIKKPKKMSLAWVGFTLIMFFTLAMVNEYLGLISIPLSIMYRIKVRYPKLQEQFSSYCMEISRIETELERLHNQSNVTVNSISI